jgi:hypothetical protein
MSSNLSDDLDAFREYVGAHLADGGAHISLEAALAFYRSQQDWAPRTPLGRRLKELRLQFVAEGGKLLNSRELEQELRDRRGEAFGEA